MLTPLYPHVLTIRTAGGLVDLAGFEVPPEAIAIPEERQQEVLTLLDGRGLPRVASRSTLTRIRITSPTAYALPGDRAALLRALHIGAACTISENLTDRTQMTVWTNALVWATPVLTRLATDVRSGTEYYGYQLEFIHTEAT